MAKTPNEIAAEAFGIGLDEVTQAHIDKVKEIHETFAKASGDEDKPLLDTTKTELEAMHEAVKKLQSANIKMERELAEFKRPDRDPDEGRQLFEQASKYKTLPDIQTAVLDSNEGEDDVRCFRKHWDILHTLSTMLGSVTTGRVDVHKLDYWKKLAAVAPDFVKAVDTATSTGGAEWAPSLYSADLQDSVLPRTGIAQLFPRVNSPRHSWVLPFQPTGGSVSLAGQATSDSSSDYTSTTPTSGAVTITAKKLVCRVPWSDEFDEDSIVAAASLFQDYSVYLVAKAIDSAIVNGDTTGTHQDTGKGFTSESPEAAWDGLRDIAMNAQSNTKDLSTFTGGNVLSMLMQNDDEFIEDPAETIILIPSKLRAKWLQLADSLTNPIYNRATPMGDAMIQSGAIADFYGSPVYTNSAVWSDCNDSGIYDNSTKTKSVIVAAFRRGFLLTDRREMSAMFYDQPLKGLRNSIVQWRGSFDDLLATTRNFVAVGYNITTA